MRGKAFVRYRSMVNAFWWRKTQSLGYQTWVIEEMAILTVVVSFCQLAVNGFLLRFIFVFVRVMTEVKTCTFFMLAVHRCSGPGKLDRQQEHQQDKNELFHNANDTMIKALSIYLERAKELYELSQGNIVELIDYTIEVSELQRSEFSELVQGAEILVSKLRLC